MDGMSGLIGEGQLDWYFKAKGFELSGAEFVVEAIIKAAYPGSNPEKARITECSIQEMLDEINRQLSVERPMWGDPTRLAPVPLLNRDAALWRLLRECIDYAQARAFEYIPSYDDDDDDELHCGITREFTFIIYNEVQRRCLIIGACNSD